jgi:heparan-alpha-glucosaminide N-acetyltransferase
VLLFAIGICIFAQGVLFSEVRVMNVLQRFAISYLVVCLVHVAFVTTAEVRAPQLLDDVKVIWREWLVMLVILAVHLGTVFGIKLDGCERGYVGPGGVHENAKNPLCTGGFVQFMDEKILTENHMFRWADVRSVYDATKRFDPEGIYGSLTSIFHTFLGFQCGMTLLTFTGHKQRIFRWVIWGAALAVLTAILTFCRIEDAPIPINKPMWSLTFVTLTSATSFWLLALIYFLVDVKNYCEDFWTIFQYPGMNAILLYIGNAIFSSHWPFHFFVADMNTHFIYLLKHMYTVTVWIIAAHIMYHKKFFFSL